MPWFILFLLLLAVMEAFPREATCSRLPDIYWNSTNPIDYSYNQQQHHHYHHHHHHHHHHRQGKRHDVWVIKYS
ncbi:hypothetical protein M0802_009745 [Mischocyttarus mexicanus]|nr:hypothetical protein M0802_009745 [Mischocyttarus mexicanus]